jgi:hypothetical protein
MPLFRLLIRGNSRPFSNKRQTILPIEVYITAYSPGSVGNVTEGKGVALDFDVWWAGLEDCFACSPGIAKEKEVVAESTAVRNRMCLIQSRL